VKDPPKPGFLSSFGSMFRSSKTGGEGLPADNNTANVVVSPEEVTTTRPRSDSDIAREFQRRINAGENL
jgi:hypothetical protein